MKYAESTNKCVKIAEKIGRYHQKVVNKQKKQDPKLTMKDKIHFSFGVFDSHVQDVLIFLTSLFSTKHDLLSFQILVGKF